MHSLDEFVPGKKKKLQNKTALPVRAIICADIACLYFWYSFIKEFPHCCLCGFTRENAAFRQVYGCYLSKSQ